ncbi:MAG: hypothetical protein M3Q10_02610 [Chloroflexota bacterium]|nr:hypothetical protein [Chloroflexota bacterium]
MDNGNVTTITPQAAAPVANPVPPRPPAPSRAAVLERRRKEREGDIDFEFKSTASGWFGKVRRPSLADRAAMGAMPTAIQDRVVFQLNKNRPTPGENPDAPLTAQRQMRNSGNNEDLANVLFLAGVVVPRVTEDEAELDGSNDVWLVTDFHLNDRLAFLQWCLGNDETAAGRVEPFRRESDGALVRVAAPASNG